MAVLEDIGSAVAAAAQAHRESVVGLGRGWSVGSGGVIAPGRVITNAHNLRHDEVTITFADGHGATGRVAGSDPDADLAVIDVETGDAPSLEWSDDEEPVIGTPVIALANPGGRGYRATFGLVSSAARGLRGPRGRWIAGAIEHTAPLPRGSSGGPLLDTEGKVIGLNAVRADGGLILAIPADAAFRERVEGLGRGEPVRRARLGVAIAPPRVARRMRRAVGLPEREGVLVRAVEPDSPAEQAGIVRGDLIAAAGERAVDRTEVLYDALDGAGDSLELVIVRGTDERSTTVRFSEAQIV